MSRDAIKFDSVAFWDMAAERHLQVPGDRNIQDIGMVPLPGDRISFERDDEQFIVVYREFKFRRGTCFIMVNVQPAARGK
jgi:hypothetical protein